MGASFLLPLAAAPPSGLLRSKGGKGHEGRRAP